ncbi:MAG TPA: TIR domain-containing protein, partial [Pyrinomonadaceae bacterium]|nr:TIR domain-containing protein [Pyrinomonadaceae bacterium]
MSQVFISHSSRDNAIAQEIGARLRLQGHRELFLDFDPQKGIPAGRDWEREIYRQLRSCRAMLVLCSEHSMSSNWCFAEIAFAKSLGKDVFPIRVQPCWCGKQPCVCINPILTSKQIVDLTGEREAAYQRIWRGLVEAGLDPADMFEWDGDRAPYPGLNAFQEEDCAVFFGREKDIRDGLDALNRLRRLGASRALLVLGSSGSGKSSLVRAGLLPRLRRNSDHWLILPTVRPQGAPVRELAIALAAAFKDAGSPRDWKEIRDNLNQAVAVSPPNAEVLNELAIELLVETGKREASILVTIDQAEELLAGDQESKAFLDFLSAALDQPHSRVIAIFTLRSDFLGTFQQTGIGQALEFADLRVGPMSADQLIEVIEGPARVAGLELEPALVQSLIRDAETEGALPLLAFTLRELYERGGGDGRLEMREYRDELGGLEGSLARVAESVFRENSNSVGLDAELRAAFLSMVRLNDDGQYSRRPASWDELPAPVRPLIERFIAARLLVARDVAGERIVEVAHEALFRAWNRLKEWLDENRADLFRRELLHRAARDWADGARAPELLVHRGGRLEEAERLFSNPAFVFDETDKSYFQSCLDARAADRESRRRMADTARVAIASDWLSRDPTTAALILCEVEQPDKTLFAVQRMIEVLNHRFAEVELRGHTAPVRFASFSPKGDFVLTAGEDNTARIWRSDGRGQPVVLAGHTQMLRLAVFSPDGERVLTASDDGTARVWRADGTGKPVILEGHSDGLMTAAFDPSGQRVITASRDKTARVWRADGSGDSVVLQGHEAFVTVGTFSPGGDKVLTASFDGTARVWPIGRPGDPLIFLHKRSVLVADFCPRGERIVTGTAEGVTTVWPLDGTQGVELPSLESMMLGVSFSPDGERV